MSTPLILHGKYSTLVPLSEDHHDNLIEAVQDGELWNLWYTLIPKPNDMKKEINRRLSLQKKGSMLPFSIINNKTNQVIGMTTFLNLDLENRRLEIGGTWIRKSMQRTNINTDAKIALLTHAFEVMNCHAVEFRTHFCNQQSRRGIERLGARLDGVLRHHMIMPDNTVRDTCVYSIISSEWPTIKVHLNYLNKKQMVTAHPSL